MVDYPPEFEQVDNLGKTLILEGTVGTTPINIPSSKQGMIDAFEIYMPLEQTLGWSLFYSIDDGTTWIELTPGDSDYVEMREGDTPLEQLKVKGSTADVKYHIKLALEMQ